MDQKISNNNKKNYENLNSNKFKNLFKKILKMKKLSRNQTKKTSDNAK